MAKEDKNKGPGNKSESNNNSGVERVIGKNYPPKDRIHIPVMDDHPPPPLKDKGKP